MGRLLTAAEVSERTTLAVSTLYAWRCRSKEGVPLGFTLGGRVVWDEDEINAWITRQRATAGGAS